MIRTDGKPTIASSPARLVPPVKISDQLIRSATAAEAIAFLLPTEDEWDSAADFMEQAAALLDFWGVVRPAHYSDED